MTDIQYPVETFDDPNYDDGTMPENVAELAKSVIGRKIVLTELRRPNEKDKEYDRFFTTGNVFVLTLDDGTKVKLFNTSDCCAYTELESFLLNPKLVDHVILGVGTEEKYQTWHIYADLGDVLTLKVGWSCGNPFYYGYGFKIAVVPFEDEDAVG